MDDYGIYGLIVGYLAGALFGWIYTSIYYNKVLEQKNVALMAIKEGLFIAIVVFIPVYSLNFLDVKPVIGLIWQLILGSIIFVIILRQLKRELFNNLLVKVKIRKPKI